MAGTIVGCGVAVEAGAFSVGSVPPVPPEGEAAVAVAASPPPHLTGRLPAPPGWALDAQGLPTLQDLGRISPTYAEPPPGRSRGHGRRR